ncbi:Xanthine dehydrogenase [Nymphon striatum]|nr:Xanthine dehydrogenase [Nymphon striatum]
MTCHLKIRYQIRLAWQRGNTFEVQLAETSCVCNWISILNVYIVIEGNCSKFFPSYNKVQNNCDKSFGKYKMNIYAMVVYILHVHAHRLKAFKKRIKVFIKKERKKDVEYIAKNIFCFISDTLTSLKSALTTLESEIVPDSSDPVLSSAAYRKSLCVSLLYKFILGVIGESVSSKYQSGGTDMERPLSGGHRSYFTNEVEWPLTQPVQKLECSGEAQYAGDFQSLRGQLYAAFVLSTEANAKLESIESKKALVSVTRFIYHFDKGIQLLASTRVKYNGQPIAIVLAETEYIAEKAVKLVKVTYSDIKTPIIDIKDAIDKKSFVKLPLNPPIIAGNVEGKGEIGTGAQYHFHMETQTTYCVPTDIGLDVHSSTQIMNYCQGTIADILGIKSNEINMIVKRVGGGYGAKLSRSMITASACALSAHNTNRYPHAYFGIKFNATISIYTTDGTVSISHGGIEMGQGINTKAAQVCAYELGIPLSMVRVKETNSLISPNQTLTGGSIGSDLVAFDIPGGYDIYGMTAAEIELDVLTGIVQIPKVDMLYDCGDSMSPAIDIGQIEGAFVMGIGLMMSEQMKYDPKNGELLTKNTWEYKPPTTKDIPIQFNITLLKNTPNPLGVLGSKATGEPPLCMSSSVLFAIRDAIQSAREDAGKKERITIHEYIVRLEYTYTKYSYHDLCKALTKATVQTLRGDREEEIHTRHVGESWWPGYRAAAAHLFVGKQRIGKVRYHHTHSTAKAIATKYKTKSSFHTQALSFVCMELMLVIAQIARLECLLVGRLRMGRENQNQEGSLTQIKQADNIVEIEQFAIY